MNLTEQQKRQDVRVWNSKRSLRDVAVAIGVTVDEARDYLETRGTSGYPGRIRLYTPSSASSRSAPSIPALPKGWG